MIAYATNEPKKLEQIIRQVAPIQDEKPEQSAPFATLAEDDLTGAGEFVKSWWPKGGLGARDDDRE